MKPVFLTLLTLVIASLACSVQVAPPTTAPTKALLTQTPNALGTAVFTVTITSSAWTAKVKLPTVNVREKPDGKVIANVTVGKLVTIVQCDGSWCQISAPVKGYVFRGCLSDNPESLGCEAK